MFKFDFILKHPKVLKIRSTSRVICWSDHRSLLFLSWTLPTVAEPIERSHEFYFSKRSTGSAVLQSCDLQQVFTPDTFIPRDDRNMNTIIEDAITHAKITNKPISWTSKAVPNRFSWQTPSAKACTGSCTSWLSLTQACVYWPLHVVEYCI